ncbi:UspA domain protein [Desulfonatronospira thiodismutans ASO3-1]|uniref:Universal stress protein n=1 Tax=Desulfonatronospira thiodismutans ASO3-1 TaxID=555779 RepID=D6SMK6_9BACT|nr:MULTISPECIES: universal stress protein [Desulfonatronospira]EFI35917.1 UspA domain protein [Desulfonatronospira thiodismutans ASO3-1]RQD73615.1 MAG: universal stress protein [Desulfonatronospira sp. MSAO_Bac3]
MAEIKKILCAVDFSEMTPKVVEYADTLAKKMDADVHVIFVVQRLDHYASFNVAPPSLQEIHGEVLGEAEKKIDALVQEQFSTDKVTAKVLSGHADEEILRYAKDENVDLIVMGTHGRKGVDRLLFGSIAEKVVKTSQVPVMTIRPQ